MASLSVSNVDSGEIEVIEPRVGPVAKPGADPADETPEGVSFRKRVRQATKEIETQIILEALEKHRWNRRKAAEDLRISYRLLMYKMKNCNLRNGARRAAAGQ